MLQHLTSMARYLIFIIRFCSEWKIGYNWIVVGHRVSVKAKSSYSSKTIAVFVCPVHVDDSFKIESFLANEHTMYTCMQTYNVHQDFFSFAFFMFFFFDFHQLRDSFLTNWLTEQPRSWHTKESKLLNV